jgi:hypothetical protein
MEKIMQEDFLEWLTEEGKKRGLQSDRQICAYCNLSPSVVSKARTGTQPIGWEACVRIADAYDVPPHVVLVKAGHMDAPLEDFDAQTEELIELFNRLSKRDREEIMTLVRMKNQIRE